jgi:putative IMPACT (imprinted ancient) family translation regulator
VTPVAREATHKLTVERSRFLALLFPAADEAALEEVLKRQRREFHKAVHHCWAWRGSGPDGGLIERSKDDGEVGHPGRVLLEILRRHDLAGGLVVSRIFGGVKLGVGGVARAFREAGEGVVAAHGPSDGPTSSRGTAAHARPRR